MITIDAFRIGAKEQIEKYGNIMALPVSYVEDYDDLKKTIAQYLSAVLFTVLTCEMNRSFFSSGEKAKPSISPS